jgi:hypothetical protein
MTTKVTYGSNGGEQQRQTATSTLWEDKEAGKSVLSERWESAGIDVTIPCSLQLF